MKNNKEQFTTTRLTLAVQGALIMMLVMPLGAYAGEGDTATLTHPTNSYTVGGDYVSKDSAKFGEYNGRNKQGADLIGNFTLSGGDGYKAFEGNDSTMRWNISGKDLGTTSRELGASVGNQGTWSLAIGYDELRHNISDTYQTPLQGSMGGNNFTLPANFGVINTTATNLAVLAGKVRAGAQIMTPTQIQDFNKVDVHTDRKNSSFTAGYNIDPQLDIKFNYNRLVQSGAKLMMVSTDAAKALSGPGGSTWGVEKMMMVTNPTNYSTDTFSVDLNWKGDNAFFTAGYNGSYFRDAYNSLTFPNPFVSGGTAAAPKPDMGTAGIFPVNTISTMPDNDFNQLVLNGGYNFTPSIKLVGGLSHGRNTQNDAYPFAMMQSTVGVTGATANPMGGGLPPVSSLNGLVITNHADMKLTDQANKDLMLSAAFKYNERDNQTASYAYNFIDLGGKNRTSVNTPMSNKKTQFELAADYRIDKMQKINVSYNYEEVKRWCNNALANNTVGVVPAGYVTTVNSCVQVPQSKENKLSAGYKLTMNDAVNFNAGYSYADRKADVNASFYNPMQALAEGYEASGYRAFFDASRTEQLLKAGVNWQANDKLSVGLNGRYTDDKYGDSTLGVQNGKSTSVNLDMIYSYSDTGLVSAYMSTQHRQRDLTNLAGHTAYASAPGVTPVVVAVLWNNQTALDWTNNLTDQDNMVGLNVKQKNLMGGKLELNGDLNYSAGKTTYSTQIPYTPTASTCGALTSLTCGSTPDITSKTLKLTLSGVYQVDKANKVAVGYMYQKLKTNDYYYNFYQTGYTGTGNLPTNEQAPNYTVNVVSVVYVHEF